MNHYLKSLLLCFSLVVSSNAVGDNIFGPPMPREGEQDLPRNVIIGPCLEDECHLFEVDGDTEIELEMAIPIVQPDSSIGYFHSVDYLRANTRYKYSFDGRWIEFETGAYIDTEAPVFRGGSAIQVWKNDFFCNTSDYTNAEICFESIEDDHATIEQLRVSDFYRDVHVSRGQYFYPESLCAFFTPQQTGTLSFAMFDAAGNFTEVKKVDVKTETEGLLFCCASTNPHNASFMAASLIALSFVRKKRLFRFTKR